MPLQLVAHDGDWLVFNQLAFRNEVVAYLWGPGFEPTINELYSRSDTTQHSDLVLPDDHWALAQTAVAARADLYRSIRPEIRRLMETLPSQARPLTAPEWVPAETWRQFLAAGNGVHRYLRASRYQTDVILIKQDGVPWAGYAEQPTDEVTLRRIFFVTPPSTLRRLLGAETPDQARIRWLVDANRGFNQFMWRQVSAGVGPAQAYRNYQDAVHRQFVAAFLPLIGCGGSAWSVGAQVGDGLRAFDVIPSG
jgi:hypothetical protein